MKEEQNYSAKPQEKEVDLGVFFSLIGNIVKKIGLAFRGIFLSLSEFFLVILLFIKRKIIWLAIGALIGLGLGVYRYSTKGPAYYSDMVVRTNFESARLLYNKIEYYNSLIKENRIKDLSQIFGITDLNAQKLIRFDIEPVNDDMQAAKLYRSTFLDYEKRGFNGVDTLWAKTMDFEEFKAHLNYYDFPLHRVRVYSSQLDVYPKIEEGILRSVINNKELVQVKQASISIMKDEEDLLRRSLSGLDSLRQAYNKKIAESGAAGSGGGNSLYVSDKDPRNPEIDLYDKELIFKDELMDVKRKAIEQQNILQVYSDFNPTGTKSPRYDQDFARFTWIGALVALAVLLLIEIYTYLDQVDKKRKYATSAGK